MATRIGKQSSSGGLLSGDGTLARTLPKLLTAVAIGIAAWLGTVWFWYFSGLGANRAPAVPSSDQRLDLRTAAEALAVSQLFGAPKSAQPATVQVSSLNLKLKGVFAGHPDRLAYAIVNAGKQDEHARVGAEITPGVVLDSVHPTHVLVKRGGVLERVNLEERTSTGSRASMALARPMPRITPPPPPQPAPTEAPAAPALGATVPGVPVPGMPGVVPTPGLQPGVPSGVPGVPNVPGMVGPQSGNSFGRIGTRPDGIAIEAAPPGSVLANLGLQPGDVVRSVNGQPVTSAADIARIYQQANAGNTLQAEVTRGGQSVPLQVTVRR